MSSVSSSFQLEPKRTYIAGDNFVRDFFAYTITVDPNTYAQTGALSAVTTNSALTPAGRTLRENGKKLWPGQSGVSTYMVGVYDDISFLSGYINPNAGVFSPLNTDKPTYLTTDSEVAGSLYPGQNLGPSVYTNGNVTLRGKLITSGGTTAFGTRAATPSALDLSAVESFFSVTNGISGVITLTATNAPPTGARVTGFFTGGNYAITLGTGFSPAGTVTPNSNTIAINFVSNGTTLIELTRSGNLNGTLVYP